MALNLGEKISYLVWCQYKRLHLIYVVGGCLEAIKCSIEIKTYDTHAYVKFSYILLRNQNSLTKNEIHSVLAKALSWSFMCDFKIRTFFPQTSHSSFLFVDFLRNFKIILRLIHSIKLALNNCYFNNGVNGGWGANLQRSLW